MTSTITTRKTVTNSIRTLCCLLLMIGLWTTNANAATATIGTGTLTTNGPTADPIERYYNYTHYQMVVTAAELTAAGMPSGAVISALGYSVSESAASLANFTISMGHTAQASASPGIAVGGLTTVRTAFTYVPVVQLAGSFQAITFTSNFTWNGTSNIVINTCTGSNPFTSPYGGLRYTTGPACTFARTDNTSNCAVTTASTTPNRPNIQFTYTGGSPCSTPAPGNTVASANPVCSGASFTLSLQNSTAGSGVTYQWYKNAVLQAGATSSTYVTSQTSASTYYCAVTCSTGPSTVNSNNLFVTMNGFLSCYCVGTANCADGDHVTSVNFNTGAINNATGVCLGSGGNSAYSDYSAQSASVTSGNTYPITVHVGNGGTEYAGVWIDYNQSGTFDASEFTDLGVGTGSGSPDWIMTGNITISGGATVGTTRMRVRSKYSPAMTSADACTAFSYGETEDYTIVIAAPAPCSTPAPGNTVASSTSACAGGSVNLSLQFATSGTGVTYQWYNTGGPIGGATLATYTTPALFASETYYCAVTCSTGPSTVNSNSQTISIAATPVGGTATGPSTGLTYANLAYSVTGTTGSLQWQVSTDNITFSDIGGATTSNLNATVNAGGTYYIRCKAYNAGCTDAFSNVITLVVTVSGDNVCSANVLALGNNGPYTNVGATAEVGEVQPPQTGCAVQTGWCVTTATINSVWFTYTPVVSGKYAFGLNGNLNYWDNQLAIYSAAACSPFGGFTLIAANDDSLSSPFNSYIAPVCLTGGVTYYILGDGYGAGTNNSWGIRVTKAANVAPVIGACPANITNCNTASVCTGTATWTNPTATDDCGGATVVCVPASGSTFAAGATTVTCTATDAELSTSTCSFSVTINDCEAPVITVPAADMTVECDGAGNLADFNQWLITDWGNADATDNCNSAAQLDNYWVNNYTSFNYTCGGNVGNSGLVAFQVYDYPALNYSATTSATFYIVDTQAPVIGSCPGNITQCAPNFTASWTNPSVTDVCGATVACVPVSGSTFAVGTTTVTCTATDCGLNTDVCTFTVTINETPVISACPSNISQCDVYTATWTDPTATGTPAASISCSPASGSTFAAGTTTVTCTATNSCGSDQCTFTVTINETPVISACPANISQCDVYTATWTDPTATGTPAASVSCSPASGSTFAAGTTTVTCTATNSCGSDQCTFTVTINETPVIGSCPSNITTCNPVVTYTDPTATGTPAATVTCSPASGSTFALGTTTVTCTATNSCGSSSCSFTVNVQTPSTAATSATSTALYGQVCVGGSVTLTANGGSLGTGASWVWYDGGCGSGASVGSGSPLTITPALGNHNYFVRAEGVCGNTACVNVAVSVISAPPSNTIGITAAPADGCVSAPAQTVSVNAVANCTFYNWSSSQAGVRFNGNPSPFQTTVPTVNVTFVSLPAAGASGWSICVFGGNACGNTNTICTWVRATVSMPTSITGSVIGCPGTSGNAYSSSVVAGAASYQWSSTGGIVITGNGAQAVTVAFPGGFVSGTLSVRGQTACGYQGPNRTITITANPAIPGTITGPSYPCPNASASYSIAAVPGAANYTWTTTVPGAIVTGTGTSCSIAFPATIPAGSTVSVVANSSCPTSSPTRSKGIATGLPGVPFAISGPASGQCGQTGVSYSINPVFGATGYSWTATCGITVGPTNLSGLTIDWPASFTTCTLSVTATNACGTGIARTLVVFGAPAIPASITGNAAPCANSVEGYSASSVGASSYNWTVPAGAVILGPANGASILVQWAATSGNITVTASNACGTSGVRSLPCVISCRQSQVTGSASGLNAQVYPNPATEKATVKFTATSAAQYHLNLTDVIGRNVLSTDGTATEGINMVDLDLNNLAKGVYMLNIMSGDNNELIRVVVE